MKRRSEESFDEGEEKPRIRRFQLEKIDSDIHFKTIETMMEASRRYFQMETQTQPVEEEKQEDTFVQKPYWPVITRIR